MEEFRYHGTKVNQLILSDVKTYFMNIDGPLKILSASK